MKDGKKREKDMSKKKETRIRKERKNQG